MADTVKIDDLKEQLNELKNTKVQTEIAFHQVTGVVLMLEEIIEKHEKEKATGKPIKE